MTANGERLHIPSLSWAACPEDVGLSRERLGCLSGSLQRGLERRAIPGAVALVARRGQLAWLQSFGRLNPQTAEPMRADAIFRIASMSKPITSLPS